MTNKICFVVEESPNHPGRYIIAPQHDNFHLYSAKGSFNIICARLFELSYAQYLRMCRDVLGAEIIGKNCLYPVAYFSDKIAADRLCKLLNARANYVLWMRENSDNYKEKETYIKSLEKRHKELMEARSRDNI